MAGSGGKPGGAGVRLGKRQRADVAAAVHEAETLTGLQIAVYLGPTEADPGAHAERLLHEAGGMTAPAVLVLVAPEARRVELRTAPAARARVPDLQAGQVVSAMTRRFAAGELVEGIVDGIRLLAHVAGPPPEGQEPGEDLPDLLGP